MMEAGSNGEIQRPCIWDMAYLWFSATAISTLLQPPIVRTGLLPQTHIPSGHRVPSSKDIPPVTLTNIPHIESSAFRPYLQQAGSLYEAFQRAKESQNDQQTHRRTRTSSKPEQVSGLLDAGKQRRQGSLSSIDRHEAGTTLSSSPLGAPQPKRRTSGGVSRRGPLPITPLSTIPNVYFESDFHLENPRIFDVVSERSEIVRPPPGSSVSMQPPGQGGRKALATNAILQEKLSWYMDTVEIHLISSISTASTSFFAALGSLRDLHTEASDSVARIKRVRQDLAGLDRAMAQGGLKIIAMRRRRENMRRLGDAVKQLNDVVGAVANCEEQVDNGQIEDALKGLTRVERLIAGDYQDWRLKPMINTAADEPRKLVDLRGVKALDGADRDIQTLRHRIGKGFESRFVEALLADLRKHVDSVQPNTTFQRWDTAAQRSRGGHVRNPSIYPSYLQVEDESRAIWQANLEGLAKSDSIMPATIAYREAVLREVKSLIRRHLPSSSDDDNESTLSMSTQGGRVMTQQEKSSILARNLRALDPEESEDLLKKTYANVGEALRRLGTQVKVVLDITSTFRSATATPDLKSPISPPHNSMDNYMSTSLDVPSYRFSSPQEEIQQALDMSNLLGQAVDIAQAQITKILKVRSDQSVRLELPQFLRYFQMNRMFADECEAVSGRGGAALKTVVNAHIKDFVSSFGEIERQKLVQGMDSDRWDAKDFTEADNEKLTQIMDASTHDVEIWHRSSSVWDVQKSLPNGQVNINGDISNGASNARDKIRSATIDEQKYILPNSALVLLNGIEHFEHLITGIPSMTQEITASLLDFLKLFNSRSSQLILGAGATRSAGLKNITTKHLALASQALSFVVALTPHVREFARRHASGSGYLMTEFDKVKRLYQEHQSGINDKLVDIMSSRAGTHVDAMRKVKWDTPANSEAASPFMETLVKETTTLHKVLGKHLPEMTVRMIMDPVFASYREQWGKAFQDVEVKTVAGKQRYSNCSLPTLMISRG